MCQLLCEVATSFRPQQQLDHLLSRWNFLEDNTEKYLCQGNIEKTNTLSAGLCGSSLFDFGYGIYRYMVRLSIPVLSRRP